MALEFKYEPSNRSSVNNEILFVIDEATKAHDDVTYPDYTYVLDLYVDSVLIQRQKVRPRPDSRFGVFDVSAALQGFVSYVFDASNTTDYDVKIDYRIKLGEEYDGTLYTNLVEDSDDRKAYKTFEQRPFSNSIVIENGLASSMPSIVNVGRDQLWHLIPVYSDVSGITDLQVVFKDKNNSTLSTQTFSNAGFVGDTIRQYNIGSLTKPSNTEYALISGAGITEVRVNYLCETRYSALTLVWLNKFGAYESQSFGLVSKKSIGTEKKTFSRLPYQVEDSGNVSYESNDVFFGSKREFATNIKTRLSLTSHLLSDDEYDWLSALFISDDVYLFLPDKEKFTPVSVQSNNYEYRTFKNSKLTPLEFSIEFSDDYNAQRL